MEVLNARRNSAAEPQEGVAAVIARLNQAASALHRLQSADQARLPEVLAAVAEGAAHLAPGATAAACTFGESAAPGEGGSSLPTLSEWAAYPPAVDPAAALGPEALCPKKLGALALASQRPARSPGIAGDTADPESTGSSQQAVAAFPISAPGAEKAVLYVHLPEGRVFDETVLLLMETFAGQAAIAIEQARQLSGYQRELARKEDELARLRHAGLLISSRLGLQETLEAILQMAMEVTDAHYGIFRLVEGDSLVARAMAGERRGRPATEPLPMNATSVMGWVAKQRQPLRIPDLRALPWSRIYYPLDHELEMRSELAVPLIGADGRLEGVLNVESPALDAFSEADSRLLEALATQAVVAIQQARLLDALREVAALAPAQPYQQVLDRLFELASEILGRGSGVAWSQATGEPMLVAPGAASEWDQKVLAILNYYVTLARQNAARQEALRAAQERQAVAETFAALGDISANLLHHLNNKVGTIPVRVEGIQDKCAATLAENVYLAANLAEIEKSATEAMRTVRESLALLHPIHPESLEVEACVESAIAAAHLPAGVEVRREGIAGLPHVLASQASLTLVIVNLLSNAAEAMQGRGRISISAAAAPGEVTVRVSDTGPGIPADLHDRIFELHFSGRRSSNTHKLGFGLWWVKTLMARLGGAVTVESDGRRGASFYLRLPAADGEVHP